MALEYEGSVDCVTAHVNGILVCYSELCLFPNLEPSPKVNHVFEKLISLCSQVTGEADTSKVNFALDLGIRFWVADNAQILTDPKIVAITSHLRQLCADGEYQLELHWAQKIGACKTSSEGSFLDYKKREKKITTDQCCSRSNSQGLSLPRQLHRAHSYGTARA